VRTKVCLVGAGFVRGFVRTKLALTGEDAALAALCSNLQAIRTIHMGKVCIRTHPLLG
jgi:hypothetical protein